MQEYNPIIVAMGVDQHGEPDAETNKDAIALLARAIAKGKDGHITKFKADGSGVAFCDSEGAVSATPGHFAPGFPALYFLVHGSKGKLYINIPGDEIKAAGLHQAALSLGGLVGRPFAYINIVACALLAATFKKDGDPDENGETNVILPLATLFNREQAKPTIAAYRKIVFVDKDGSKTMGFGNKSAQDGSSKEYKVVYKCVQGNWVRCKNFHNKEKVAGGLERHFDGLPADWNFLPPAP